MKGTKERENIGMWEEESVKILREVAYREKFVDDDPRELEGLFQMIDFEKKMERMMTDA